jgi:hypothetical protein
MVVSVIGGAAGGREVLIWLTTNTINTSASKSVVTVASHRTPNFAADEARFAAWSPADRWQDSF